MVLRLLTLVFLLSVSRASLSQQLQSTAPSDVLDTCPLTRSPTVPFIPPKPYPVRAGPGWFWFGTKRLWTMLSLGGVWSDLPHTESGYTQKIGWLSESFDWKREPYPAIKVVGKRLNSGAPTLTVIWINGGHTGTLESIMGVRVNIPALGCWQITGRYKDEELTFVVWVAK